MILSFRELIVWQRSMQLVKEVYRLVGFLPPDERYALSDQLRRAVVSIPSNIAEGYARKYQKEYVNFLSIGGKEKMCAITERWYKDGWTEGVAEGVAEGKVEGKAEGKAEAAKSLIKSSVPVMAIMQATGLSLEKLQEMSQQLGVALVRS